MQMEALPKRDYHRQLWQFAVAGLGWKAHVFSLVVGLAAAAVRYISTRGDIQSQWPQLAGLAIAAGSLTDLALLFARRFLAAPYEFYERQSQQYAERDTAFAALQDQARRQPRPRLVLTYAVESLKGFEEEVSNPPILLHNEGDATAVEAQVEALQLSPLIKVTFTAIQRIAAQDTAAIVPRIEIRTESGGWELDHNDKHLGLAIQRAHVELAHRNVKTQHGSRHWTMTVRYYDADGTPYVQNADLILHVPTMRAWTVFLPPQPA